MKVFMSDFYICLLCLLLSTSCVRVEDLERIQPKLSINCLFMPDSCWKVMVTKGDINKPVTSMSLFVRTQSGTSIPLVWDEKSRVYLSKDLTPHEGEAYELVMGQNEEESLLSTSIVPPVAVAQNICATRFESELKIEFDLVHNESIPYYCFQFSQQFMNRSFVIPILSANFDFENKGENADLGYSYVMVRNHSISNQIKWVVTIAGNRILRKEPIILRLESCSEDAGRYKSTIQQYDFDRSTPIYSNIYNEFGIWGGYNQSIYTIEVADFQ